MAVEHGQVVDIVVLDRQQPPDRRAVHERLTGSELERIANRLGVPEAALCHHAAGNCASCMRLQGHKRATHTPERNLPLTSSDVVRASVLQFP